MASREICKICFHPNPIGFHVPNEIWKAAIPDYYQKNIVCIMCFARLADERLIQWDNDIELYPVSFVTHLGPIHGIDMDADIEETD